MQRSSHGPNRGAEVNINGPHALKLEPVVGERQRFSDVRCDPKKSPVVFTTGLVFHGC